MNYPIRVLFYVGVIQHDADGESIAALILAVMN